MTEIEKAIADIEAFISCEAGLCGSLSQTGEPYREVSFCVPVTGRMSVEREVSRISDPEFIAARAIVEIARSYARDVMVAAGHRDFSRLTLYWRVRPEAAEQTGNFYQNVKFILDKKEDTFETIPALHVYARFLVTDKSIGDGPAYPRAFD
jgi:hypothetical protein